MLALVLNYSYRYWVTSVRNFNIPQTYHVVYWKHLLTVLFCWNDLPHHAKLANTPLFWSLTLSFLLELLIASLMLSLYTVYPLLQWSNAWNCLLMSFFLSMISWRTYFVYYCIPKTQYRWWSDLPNLIIKWKNTRRI